MHSIITLSNWFCNCGSRPHYHVQMHFRKVMQVDESLSLSLICIQVLLVGCGGGAQSSSSISSTSWCTVPWDPAQPGRHSHHLSLPQWLPLAAAPLALPIPPLRSSFPFPPPPSSLPRHPYSSPSPSSSSPLLFSQSVRVLGGIPHQFSSSSSLSRIIPFSSSLIPCYSSELLLTKGLCAITNNVDSCTTSLFCCRWGVYRLCQDWGFSWVGQLLVEQK